MSSGQVVIDLCDDDDDEGVAKLPAAAPTRVIDLLDDDNHASPLRRHDGKENGHGNAATPLQDRKPAARAKNSPSEPVLLIPARPPPSPQPFATGAAHMPLHIASNNDDRKPAAASAAAAKPPPAEVKVTSVIPPPLSPLEQVLEVFPDVDRNHAQNLLSQHGNPMTLVAILAESSYPKSKTTHHWKDDGITLHRDKRQRTYDFMSTSSFEPSPGYTEQARAKLHNEFPFLSSNGTNKLLKTHNGHYAIAHDAVCRGIMDGGLSKDADQQEEQYRLFKSALSGVHLSEEQHAHLMVGRRRTTVLHPRRTPRKPVHITNDILLQEIDYVQQKQAEWMEEVNLRLVRKQNRAAAQKAGATIECPCCCFEVAVDEMIACRQEGHLFCVDCVRRFAETQIFTLSSFGVDRKTGKPATDLLCMHSDGCSSGFDVTHLRKALSEKLMAKYDELQYRAAVDAAGIELFSCPKCGIQAEIPQAQMIFHCPEQSCGQETCKLCGEPAHIPLKCSKVEKKHETQGRLKVEEAISNAKIRTCPKPGCGKKFVKLGNDCNKMTCACGTWSCYMCRALIPRQVGYKHFCQTPLCNHASCNMCPLYSNVEEDDKRAMREAGFEAAEQVRGESLLSASDAKEGVAAALPSEVRIDVDSLLKEAPGAARPTSVLGRRR